MKLVAINDPPRTKDLTKILPTYPFKSLFPTYVIKKPSTEAESTPMHGKIKI